MHWYFPFIFILLIVIPSMQRRKRRRIAQLQRKRKQRKGEKRKMPIEMLREYVGQTVTILVAGDLAGGQYTLLQVEENWIKAENKGTITIFNGDMISSISIAKPKHK